MIPCIVPKSRCFRAADLLLINVRKSSSVGIAYRSHGRIVDSSHRFSPAFASSTLPKRNKSTTTTTNNNASTLSSRVSPWMQSVLQYVQKVVQKRKDHFANPNRPQGSWERVQNFPEGVKALIRDCFDYQTIRRTPLDDWTTKVPPGSGPLTKLGRIPRREYEQQRQLRNDFRTMLPLIIIWIPPIIGFIPPLLAIFAPRQVMSRHFHTPHEQEWFAQIEYGQRLSTYSSVAERLQHSLVYHYRGGKSHREVFAALTIPDQADAAGPLLDAVELYRMVFSPDNQVLPPDMYRSIRNLPREHLVPLSLAMGINQYLPGWMSTWVTAFQPSLWLQSQVDRMSRVICQDDAMLIQEKYHLDECQSMTEPEVRDACLMRGLPVRRQATLAERRTSLTNHLIMVEKVRADPATRIDSDGFRLFTAHLAPLRYWLKHKQKQQQQP